MDLLLTHKQKHEKHPVFAPSMASKHKLPAFLRTGQSKHTNVMYDTLQKRRGGVLTSAVCYMLYVICITCMLYEL